MLEMARSDLNRRKLRGGRRYSRHLQRWASKLRVDLSPGHWYDLWHQHPDFFGWSRKSGRWRRAHLVALFEAFEMLLRQVAEHQGAYQAFLGINRQDSPGDAIYFHTPNPNSSNFPHAFSGFSWDAPIPSWLAPFVDRQRFEFGQTSFEGDYSYVVVPRGKGGRI